jgi:hypothetical protein
MMTEFKKIFLQPECCVEDQDVGRMWCQDNINDCEEGNEWIEYVLASESKQRIAELEKERDEFKAIAFSITPEIIDFVRCGIGANYGGSCYNEKMEKTYAPILASFKALKEQDNG